MVSHKWSQNKHEFAWKVQYIDQVYSLALTLKIMCNLEEYRPMLCLGPSAYKAVIEIWSVPKRFTHWGTLQEPEPALHLEKIMQRWIF